MVRSLEIVTWVQLHPASLPSLRKGVNRMEYVSGDHHGLPTHVMEIRASGGDREAFLTRLIEVPPDYEPSRRTGRAVGAFVARFEAPPGSRVAWFSAGGAFAAHQGADAPRTRNSMAWAAERPEGFRTFYVSEIPADNSHWHTNADVEVKLEQPARAVFVRYTGDPGVDSLRIYAHCVHEKSCAPSPVKITHAWREGGRLKTHEVFLERPGDYEISVGEEPEDEWIELSSPGGS